MDNAAEDEKEFQARSLGEFLKTICCPPSEALNIGRTYTSDSEGRTSGPAVNKRFLFMVVA